MAYLIDSNIFIRSKNEMPMNLWPTVWQRMTDMVNSGELFISTKVKEEIERGNDELTEWLKGEKTDVVVSLGAGNIDRLVEGITEALKEKI